MNYQGILFKDICYTVVNSKVPVFNENDIEKALLEYYSDFNLICSDVVSVLHDNLHNSDIIIVSTFSTDLLSWISKNTNLTLRFWINPPDCKSTNILVTLKKELNMTNAELGIELGYSESAIKSVSRTGELSIQMNKVIELYRKVLSMEKELSKFEALKTTFKELIL